MDIWIHSKEMITDRTRLVAGPFVLFLCPSLNDRGRDVVWHFAVLGEFHGVAGAALGHGAEVRRVAEHFGQRDHGVHDACAHALAHVLDLTALGVQVTDDIAHELFRHDDFDLHDRFEQVQPGFLTRFLEGK